MVIRFRSPVEWICYDPAIESFRGLIYEGLLLRNLYTTPIPTLHSDDVDNSAAQLSDSGVKDVYPMVYKFL
jgi:hypothetical protein